MTNTKTLESVRSDSALSPDVQTVTYVRHWTPHLFSFRVTRPRSLRFRSGEFLMLGLEIENASKRIMRAYSIASPVWDEELEFYSIIVPDGPLTSRLQKIEIGDSVIVRPKPVGTLVLDGLLPGERCYLVASGTGIAPFASLARDPEIYSRFDEVILTHTCRTRAELAYGEELVQRIMSDALVGDDAATHLKYYPTTTRESSPHEGRVTDLMRTGELFRDLGLPPLGPNDRMMICGSMALNEELAGICESAGLVEGSNSNPGSFLREKAFVG